MAVKSRGAMQRQNDSIKAQEAWKARDRLCKAVEARIAEHGASGLPARLVEKGYELADNTVKTSVLLMVRRLCDEDTRLACREVLPCF